MALALSVFPAYSLRNVEEFRVFVYMLQSSVMKTGYLSFKNLATYTFSRRVKCKNSNDCGSHSSVSFTRTARQRLSGGHRVCKSLLLFSGARQAQARPRDGPSQLWFCTAQQVCVFPEILTAEFIF